MRGAAGRVLLIVALGALFVSVGLFTLRAVLGEVGPLGFVLGAVLPILPMVVAVRLLLWLDRLEAEPAGLLAVSFLWGACVATGMSLALNTAVAVSLSARGLDPNWGSVYTAPWIEEIAKGLALAVVLLVRRREFDGVVDGIVYAGVSAIGFAYVEDIVYLGRSLVDGGGPGLLFVFVLRCLITPLAHPLFTACTGIGVGIAVAGRQPVVRVLAPVLGLLAAVGLHSLWNSTSLDDPTGANMVGRYVFVFFPVLVLVVVFGLGARRREARLIVRNLTPEVSQGILTREEVRMLGSTGLRRRARHWARGVSPRAQADMKQFQHLAGELAFLRERIGRGTAPAAAAREEERLRAALWQVRGSLRLASGR